MKRTEFMRLTAKIIMKTFANLYEKDEFSFIKINLEKHSGSFQLNAVGAYLKLFTDTTGKITWHFGSSIYNIDTIANCFYAFDDNDDHLAVLKQFENDLKNLTKELKEIMIYSNDNLIFQGLITFEYGKPLSFNLEEEE